MKSTDLKTRVRFPSTISKNNLTSLRDLSIQTHIPMSVLMDQGLELLFGQYTKNAHPPAGAKVPRNDPKQDT